jgi:CHAD domain-containing protein
MSYRIEKGEGLAAALGRIAAEEMDLALTELRRRDRGRAIHSVRKAIKRLRALLRSLRVAFPKKLFREEDRRLAEAGRKISPLRDVHVQLRTLGRLRAADDPAGGKTRRDLLRRQESFARKIPALRTAVRQMLGRSRGTIGSWPLNKTTPLTLAAGLKRVYKQGRSAFKTARKNPVPENLHEWRKKVKALGFGFELIECLVPKEFSERMPLCQALGDAMGEDHDLFMVLQALGRANQSQPARDYAGLARRISAKRAKLQKHAFQLGKIVYKEKPRAFARRLDHYLEKAGKQRRKK